MDPFAAAPSPEVSGEFDADVLSVFGFESEASAEPSTEPAAAAPEVPASPTPPASSEPGEGVVAPSPSPESAAPATPSVAAEPSLESAPATPTAPTPSTPTPATPTLDPEEALRQRSKDAQIEALQAQIAQLQKPEAPVPATSASQPGTGELPEEARFSLSVPEPVLADILGEDATKAAGALNWVVNAIASTTMARAVQYVQSQLASHKQELAGASEMASAESQRQQMEAQYYEAFPDHKKPVMVPILSQVAREMAAEFPNHPYDGNYVAAMGARVNRRVAELLGGGAAPAQPAPAVAAPTPAPAPAAKPAGFVSPAPRPAPTTPDTPDEVLDIFNAQD